MDPLNVGLDHLSGEVTVTGATHDAQAIFQRGSPTYKDGFGSTSRDNFWQCGEGCSNEDDCLGSNEFVDDSDKSQHMMLRPSVVWLVLESVSRRKEFVGVLASIFS